MSSTGRGPAVSHSAARPGSTEWPVMCCGAMTINISSSSAASVRLPMRTKPPGSSSPQSMPSSRRRTPASCSGMAVNAPVPMEACTTTRTRRPSAFSADTSARTPSSSVPMRYTSISTFSSGNSWKLRMRVLPSRTAASTDAASSA